MLSDIHILHAPPSWRVVDFISDLHLQASQLQTFAAWKSYLENTHADAVFILGDLFEVWVGDDAVPYPAHMAQAGPEQPAFLTECAQVLALAARSRPLHFMHGNRDFLVGQAFCANTGMALLADPCVFQFGTERWVLSHGDALCLADVDYQQFRKTVRSTDWQAEFLAKTLQERQAIARSLRAQSAAHKVSSTPYADADESATLALLKEASAQHLVHGHTHRPANHLLSGGLQRHVLSDWDLEVTPARAQVFRLALMPDGTANVSRIAPGLA